MANGIKKVADSVSARLGDMISRGRNARGFLQEIAYPDYLTAQRKRFITENESQGDKWKSLSPGYKEWKRINYAGWVGGGQKTGIRTGRLYSGILGKSFGTKDHRKAILDTSMIVGVATPYARYVDEVRPLMSFKKEFIEGLKNKYAKYIAGKV